MRLSAPDRKKQVLEVATRLFAQQGYAATTTRQIAAECGVTEAILFRHFPSKEELYWDVIETKRASRGFLEKLKEILESNMSPMDVCIAIAKDRLERNFGDPTMTRLLLFSTLENHELSYRFYRNFIAEYHEHLVEYIEKQISGGVFRPVDPLLAARSFLAMIFYHFLIQELFGAKRIHAFDPDRLSRHIAEIWLGGMLSSNEQRSQLPDFEEVFAGNFARHHEDFRRETSESLKENEKIASS
ncbi:MAG TPA: TetR/AcrR family transcriptional regulator [Terriglobales bacterium]